MTGREVIETIAREKRVEQIVLRVSGADHLTADLSDLVQMVYMVLLEYGDEKIADLWDSGAINFLIVRLVQNNLHSKTSRFYYTIKVFSARSTDLTAVEYKTEDEG